MIATELPYEAAINLKHYIENSLNSIQTEVEKLLYTKKLLYVPGGRENWNFEQSSFDIDRTKLSVNPYTLYILAKIFPNIETIKLTLKIEANEKEFLFQNLEVFKRLTKISLTITDGLTYSPNSIVNIEILKIYFKTICVNDNYVRNLLKRAKNIHTLTLSETYIPSNTMMFLRNLPITKLSIKNPYITQAESNNFKAALKYLDLKKFKLVYTQVDRGEYERTAFSIIQDYLNSLPHNNLEELSISIPDINSKIDYLNIVLRLKGLSKLNLFMRTDRNFNKATQIIELLTILPYHIQTTIIYYRNENSIQTHFADINFLGMYFPHIKIIEKINLYITYPNLTKHERCRNKIIAYEKVKSSLNQIKPYKFQSQTIIHQMLKPYPIIEEIDLSDLEFPELIDSDDSTELDAIEISDFNFEEIKVEEYSLESISSEDRIVLN